MCGSVIHSPVALHNHAAHQHKQRCSELKQSRLTFSVSQLPLLLEATEQAGEAFDVIFRELMIVLIEASVSAAMVVDCCSINAEWTSYAAGAGRIQPCGKLLYRVDGIFGPSRGPTLNKLCLT
jgi:hypothetical protein